MSIYAEWILPRLIAWTMRTKELAPYRRRLIPRAAGRVLEVGAGSGLNFSLYGAAVEQVVALDPSLALLRRARVEAAAAPRPVTLLRGTAEAIPLCDRSIDTVVMTWTLCSLRNPGAGLTEMRRVLRPGGMLIFVEHGLAPDPSIAAWQHRLDPFWARISCHLDTPVDRLVSEAGFALVEHRSGYLGTGPRVLTFMTEGVARA